MFESRIHEKGARSHPLSEQAQERNKVRSEVRAGDEHAFGLITTCMRGKLTRRIGLARTSAWWGLQNLTYNFGLPALQRKSSAGCLIIRQGSRQPRDEVMEAIHMAELHVQRNS